MHERHSNGMSFAFLACGKSKDNSKQMNEGPNPKAV